MKIQRADHEVVSVWECKDCGEEIEVFPDYYEENGTPVCPLCDIDMRYSRTLVEA
jgi:ABC-type ATPase with predicted acetyltransferase domain